MHERQACISVLYVVIFFHLTCGVGHHKDNIVLFGFGTLTTSPGRWWIVQFTNVQEVYTAQFIFQAFQPLNLKLMNQLYIWGDLDPRFQARWDGRRSVGSARLQQKHREALHHSLFVRGIIQSAVTSPQRRSIQSRPQQSKRASCVVSAYFWCFVEGKRYIPSSQIQPQIFFSLACALVKTLPSSQRFLNGRRWARGVGSFRGR